MDYSTVAIAVSFSQWDEDRSNPQLVLKFSNPSSQTRTLALPCPLNENATTFGSPERPILVLIARELVTSGEDGFVLTDLSNRTRDAGKSLVLKPGERRKCLFRLLRFTLGDTLVPPKAWVFWTAYDRASMESRFGR